MIINSVSTQLLLQRSYFFLFLFFFKLLFPYEKFCEPCCCFLPMIESYFESSLIGAYLGHSMIRSSLVSSAIGFFLGSSVMKSSLGSSVTWSSLGSSVLFFRYASLKTLETLWNINHEKQNLLYHCLKTDKNLIPLQ